VGDPVLIGIRFALYADLMLIAGLAAFPLHALTRQDRARPELTDGIWRAERWLCAAGLLLSALGMGVLAASMQGVGLLALDAQSFRDIVGQSDVGTAWLYRSAALAAALAAAIWTRRWPTIVAPLLAVAGLVAVGTLAWSGHAGATEGAAGTFHRISDIVHMAAAAVWIGAITAFLLLLSPRRGGPSPATVAIAVRSLDRFSVVGTICVLTIAGTGLLNGQMIIGAQNLGRSLAAPYGQGLLAKFALFALMLALAAANRWRLTPALGIAAARMDAGGDKRPSEAIAALRRSLVLEAAAAFAILALVAWFGTLDPFGGEAM
jgi:putative copper resistance protein D